MADAEDIEPLECDYGTRMVERMIVLQSDDKQELEVEEKVALMLHSLKNKIINNIDEKPSFYLPGTKFATLELVIDYCMYLAGSSTGQKCMYLAGSSTGQKFHAQFNERVHLMTLFNLIQAAHHLEIKSLMDWSCQILMDKVRYIAYEIRSSYKPYHVAKRLKRDLREDKSIESILRNPRRETFIMVMDGEDVQYHHFVASQLRLINRKNSDFDGYVQTIMMSSDSEAVAYATVRLEEVISGDQSLAESLNLKVVQRLLEILEKDYTGDIKHRAIAILSHVSFDECCSSMEKKVVPLFVQLVSDNILFAREALIALTRLACAFPHRIEVIIRNHALEAVKTLVNSSHGVYDFITYSAKFLAVICRSYNLPSEKARIALDISEAILQKPRHSYCDKARACYVLSYLSHEKQVQFKEETYEILINFIYHGDPLLAGSALGVVGNIVRWGNLYQFQYFLGDTKLLQCLGKRMLLCGYKKFRKQACQIISNIAARGDIFIDYMVEVKLVKPLCSLLKNGEPDVKMEAAWALFNGINGYTYGQIDEYPKENGNCSVSI